MNYSGVGLIQKVFVFSLSLGDEAYISATTGPGANWEGEKVLEKFI